MLKLHLLKPKKKSKKNSSNSATIAQNRRARHDYFLEQTFEAGLALPLAGFPGGFPSKLRLPTGPPTDLAAGGSWRLDLREAGDMRESSRRA